MEAQRLLIVFSGIAVSTVLALVAVRLSMSLARRLNLLGRDVHKPGNVMVPKIGGLGMAVSYSVTLMLLSPRADALTLTLLASPVLSAAIGLSEDFRELNPVLKPVLLARLSDEGTPGFTKVSLTLYVRSGADEETMRQVFEEAVRRSPVYRTLEGCVSLSTSLRVFR
jgi:hypothetical protein